MTGVPGVPGATGGGGGGTSSSSSPVSLPPLLGSNPLSKMMRGNESASLWNSTLSPGWTGEEMQILRLALLRLGVGNWSRIIESGCLPGKTIAQINQQTQRMVGQQSTAEFAGLHMDVLRVGESNCRLDGPRITRKSGMIINTGDRLTTEEKRKRIEENRILYELPEEIWKAIDLPKPPPAIVRPSSFPSSIYHLHHSCSFIHSFVHSLYYHCSLVPPPVATSSQVTAGGERSC